MSEYVRQRLLEIRGAPLKPPAPKLPRVARKLPSVGSPMEKRINTYISRVRRNSPERATWFNVRDAYVEGWHSGQGDMLATLRITGPTTALVECLRRQANGLEADGLKRSAYCMREAANEIEANYKNHNGGRV